MVKVDLHGVLYEDVATIMEWACSQHETPFIVITGNSPEMKRQVSRACKTFNLSVRDSIDNPGRVVIYEVG